MRSEFVDWTRHKALALPIIVLLGRFWAAVNIRQGSASKLPRVAFSYIVIHNYLVVKLRRSTRQPASRVHKEMPRCLRVHAAADHLHVSAGTEFQRIK
jgi:hypothetical protein